MNLRIYSSGPQNGISEILFIMAILLVNAHLYLPSWLEYCELPTPQRDEFRIFFVNRNIIDITRRGKKQNEETKHNEGGF